MPKKVRKTQEKEPQEKAEAALEPAFGNVFASWEFPEYERHRRSLRWYIISIVLVVALLVFSYIDKNPLLAVIIILAILTFVISELRGVDYRSIVIAEDGVLIGAIFYPWEDLKNFYIIYKPPQVKMLYVEPKSLFRPRFGIPLENQDPVAIRKMLLAHIPEDLEKEDEPLSDLLGRLFKF